MENTTEAGVWLCGVWCVGRGAKTTTEDDDAATLHHTCILASFIYFCLLVLGFGFGPQRIPCRNKWGFSQGGGLAHRQVDGVTSVKDNLESIPRCCLPGTCRSHARTLGSTIAWLALIMPRCQLVVATVVWTAPAAISAISATDGHGWVALHPPVATHILEHNNTINSQCETQPRQIT